jgi:hypothetical protein
MLNKGRICAPRRVARTSVFAQRKPWRKAEFISAAQVK